MTHPVPEALIGYWQLSRLERETIVHYSPHAPQVGLAVSSEEEIGRWTASDSRPSCVVSGTRYR